MIIKSMNFRNLILAALVAGLFTTKVQSQSVDALVDKLIDKGILTVKEANELRDEANKNFNDAFAVKSGMPEWVNVLKFSGDIRTRYEGFYSDAMVEKIDPATGGSYMDKFENRNRFRYRLRFGATVTMFDNLEAGFRLTSSDASGNFGGDPISGNTTFQNNASKKFVYFDTAYAKWYGLNTPTLSASVTAGKMENPFVTDDMVFDPDYTPEGAAIQSVFHVNDNHALNLNLGGFVLDETALSGSGAGAGSGSGQNPYLLGAQLRWDAKWTPKWSSSIGLSYYSIQNPLSLYSAAVPDQNAGNTRTLSDTGIAGTSSFVPRGSLLYGYQPFVVDGSLTYTLLSFPLYKGAFPIRVSGEYINNPSAPYTSDAYAWNGGITFGKSGKRGTWEFSYLYKWLGGDAWYEELVDSDTGAIYAQIPTGADGRAVYSGYFAGTNVKGHVLRLAYSPYDALTLSAKAFLTQLIRPFEPQSVSQINRVQVDATLKF
jgi:hypothetical protein